MSSYTRMDVDDDKSSNDESNGFLKKGNTPTIVSSITFVKATVGIGILSLPYALRHAGIWLGIIVLLILALISWYTATLLIECLITYSLASYTEVGRFAWGRPGVVLANFSIVAAQMGTHMVHFLFLSSAFAGLVPVIPRYAWLLILSPYFVLISMIPSISKLRVLSIAGVILLVTTIVCIVGYAFSQIPPSNVIAAQINHAPIDLFIFLGTSIYVFEGINMVVPVYLSMKHRESCKQMFFNLLYVTHINFFQSTKCLRGPRLGWRLRLPCLQSFATFVFWIVSNKLQCSTCQGIHHFSSL
jgi:amino acid permease